MTSPTTPASPTPLTATSCPTTASPILLMDNVSRVHGQGDTAVRALDGVTLTVHAGELVAVMGPSGSGKSTLLNLAGGLDRPTTGAVVIEGLDVGAMSLRELAALRRRSLGFVFQDFNLIPSLTAAENVALPLELDGQRVRAARRSALDALETVGISELADRYPEHMSGGQQQRVAIARALVGERRLVLADEPTGALDSQTGEAVLRVLRARCDAGAGGLLVTHEARHAAWADRVVFLRDGVIIDTTGTAPGAESLLHSPTAL
jgi:putative ABC transport system ATP-binding protein